MSHEYYNIVIGGEGVRRRSNGINVEKITFFSNFVRVSKGLLSTIVDTSNLKYTRGLKRKRGLVYYGPKKREIVVRDSCTE